MPPVSNPKYLVNYTSGTTLATRKASMLGDGPLVAPADSWAAITIFADGAISPGGGRMGTMRLLAYVLEGVYEPSDEVLATHLAWWVAPDRMTRLLAALDAKGALPWKGTDTEKMRRAIIQEGHAKLDAAERRLEKSDLIILNTTALPGWFTRLKCEAIIGRGAWATLACFRSILHGLYGEATFGTDCAFHEILDLLQAEAEVDNSAADSVQARRVARFLESSHPEPEQLFCFPSRVEECLSEISRRAADTEEERFATLFRHGWRATYTALAEAFPQLDQGAGGAVTFIQAYAVQLGVTGPLTPATASAMDAMTLGLLPHLDTKELTGANATDEQRREALVQAHKAGARAAAAGSNRAGKAEERFAKVFQREGYKSVKEVAESMDTHPLKTDELCGKLLRSECAIGPKLVLGSDTIPQPVWANVRTALTKDIARSVLNKTLQRDKASHDTRTPLQQQGEGVCRALMPKGRHVIRR